MNSLDLYARIEPYIGFYEEYNVLYQRYLDFIKTYPVKKVLDIGCGNGKFLQLLEHNGYEAYGIERSCEMVKIAKRLGVNASATELEKLAENSFDCVVCIGDVLNYMNKEELERFFLHVKKVLKQDGLFIADINTLEGFDIADGIMSHAQEENFLAIEASFEDEVLITDINFFEKQGKLYQRYEAQIKQYYHLPSYFKTQKILRFQNSVFHSMFSEANEKEIMFFQK